MIETKYEYVNTLSKHFVESKTTFLQVFVFIWHLEGPNVNIFREILDIQTLYRYFFVRNMFLLMQL